MPNLSRREMLKRTGRVCAAGVLGPQVLIAQTSLPPANTQGVVNGQPEAEKVGAEVLRNGGNCVDAIVAAALTAAVAAPHQTGLGGYGGHMTIAQKKGGKITSIDFNSAAPSAARADMFTLDEKGNVRGAVNQWGWLAAGVPGVLAGMQLALERYGTTSFRDAAAPAIELARGGIALSSADVTRLRGCSQQFQSDEASQKLYIRDDKALAVGTTFRNPDLAAMLGTLADRNSVESFYRGDIAQRIAGAFEKHGGLVTVKDLASYRAREVDPLVLSWNGFDPYCTAHKRRTYRPAGISHLARARVGQDAGGHCSHTFAHRSATLCLADRLRLLGDPEKAEVPVTKLLSADYADVAAEQIRAVVKAGTILPLRTVSREQSGTIHLSAVDRHGNMAACTLTHGDSFGARVTVDGLGLTLGHGMSRFDPHPGHPNAPGPGKRPLHNMCPTIVLRDGHPVMALGARGGRLIPNAVFEVLTQFVGLRADLPAAVAAPRFHTDGNTTIQFEKLWPTEETEAAARIGYTVKPGSAATVSAVSFDPESGECRAASR